MLLLFNIVMLKVGFPLSCVPPLCRRRQGIALAARQVEISKGKITSSTVHVEP